MELIIAAVIIFIIYKVFNGGGSSVSGSKRSFKCHECKANNWIQTDESHYDNVSSGSYNYKEWLTCGKCGDRITNERTL